MFPRGLIASYRVVCLIVVSVFGVLLAPAATQPLPRGVVVKGRGPSGTGLWTRAAWVVSTVNSGSVVSVRAGTYAESSETLIEFPTIAAPADIDVTKTSPQETLLVGDDEVVVLRRGASNQYSIGWQGSIPGAQLVGVAYAEGAQRLYTLDATGVVRYANYQVGAAAPSVWSTLAGPASLPNVILPKLSAFMLIATDVPSGVELLLGHHLARGNEDYVEIVHGTSSTTIQLRRGADAKQVLLNHWALTPGQASVDVYGPGGSTVSVVSVFPGDHVVVGSTTLGGSAHASVFGTVSTSALQWGHVYAGLSSITNEMYGPFHTPQLVWSTNDTLPNGVSFHPAVSTTGVCAYPDGWVDGSLTVDISPAQTTLGAVSYAAQLGLNLDDPQNRPIDFSGSSPLLIPAVTFPATLQIDPSNGEPVGEAPMVLEVPDDQALIGTVVLLQWYVDTGPGIAVSDVWGVIVRSGEWQVKNPTIFTPAAAKQQPAQPLRPSVNRSAWQRCLESMAKRRGARLLTPAQQAAFMRRLRQARDPRPR